MIAIRNNSLRQSRDDLLTQLPWQYELVGFSDDALLIEVLKEELLSDPLYEAGAYYLQNLSSQLPALVLAPEPGEQVLDMCAAPGSKTTQLAALTQNTGKIIANDASRERCFKLRALLERYGVANTKVITQKGEFLWRKYTDAFDRVLVDAPCSMDLVKSPKEIKALARQQTYLMRSAIACTRPGGTIVYSTCTSDPRENEQVVAWVLDNVEGVQIEAITKLLPEFQTKEGYLKIPKDEIWESFFVAKFNRLG